MSEVVVVAKLVPREGALQELLDILATLVPRVHAEEPGNVLYAAHRVRGEENGPVVMVERFASIEAFRAHGASAAMAEHQPLLAAVLDGPPEVRVLDPVVLGEAANGSLAG